MKKKRYSALVKGMEAKSSVCVCFYVLGVKIQGTNVIPEGAHS